MEKKSFRILTSLGIVFMMAATVVTSCSKENTDVPVPKIDGYNNSDEVASANLKGYWSFDSDNKEAKSGTAPTSAVGVTSVAGVKGQGINIANGGLYYASNIAPLKTNAGFTISAWMQVKNTGSSPIAPTNVPYCYFQSAIPGQLFGNVTCMVEAGQYKFSSDTMVVKSIYKDLSGGTQDNINNYGVVGTDFQIVKKAGTGNWAHIVTTYNPNGGTGTQSVFRIYVDSVMVSNKNFENRGTAFKFTPGEVIIGGWYNNIPGKTVSSDPWTVPFNGKIDEIRIWDKLLPEADIIALYKLGKAGR